MMKNRLLYILLGAVAVLGSVPFGARAQMKSSYFMEGAIQRLDMNAAFVPERGYVNIPVLGNFGVGINSNFLSVKNFLYPNPEGSGLVTFMHDSVDADDFLRRMRKTNYATATLRDNLVGFGAYARNYFWSFGLNLRSETSMTIPKEFFEVAKTLGAGTYNLGDFGMESHNYLEFAFGAALPVHILEKRVEVGARVKVLLGAAYANVTMDGMEVELSDEVWRADMRGHFVGNVALMDFSQLQGGTMEFADLLDAATLSGQMGSWGLAFDLGAATRFLDDRLKVSVGINDLGFIAWSRKNAVRGDINQMSFSFSGYDFDAEETITQSPEQIEVTVGAPQGVARMLTATLNLGAEYNLLDEAIGIGLLSQTQFSGDYTTSELTLSANFRPCNWFTGTLSHSLIQNRLGVFGLALNAHPSWINFFVGMDYIGMRYAKGAPVPINMKSVNFYMGLAVPLSRPKADSCFAR